MHRNDPDRDGRSPDTVARVPVSGERRPADLQTTRPCLSMRTGKPAQKTVKRTVSHHDHDHVLAPELLRRLDPSAAVGRIGFAVGTSK